MEEIDILKILNAGEGIDIEFKEGEASIPKSLWESYSAMANTNGGIIILGIKESRNNGHVEVQGVKNVDIRIKEFWDTINNRAKTNKNILMDEDVKKDLIEDKDIIIINIPRANYKDKPIYLNNNPYQATYKRNSEGDYKCTEEEIKAMIRDSTDDGNDSVIIEGYIIDDLDIDTIRKYRNRFSSNHPDHPWNELDNENFLIMMGAIRDDRRKNIRGITVAGILMFGKGIHIRDLFAHINLDYREEIETNSDMRWSDRFTIDGMWENNIYNFYFSVINKLTDNIKVPFKLENLERKDDTNVHQAIREAFVNQIIHADFNIQGTLKIIKRRDYIEFSNPGMLKIDLESIFRGGNSKSRNLRLQKMFTMIGLGENAGSGFPKILSAWKSQHWRIPELQENNILNQVTLKLWTVSMIPDDCIYKLRNIYGNTLRQFNKEQMLILSTSLLEGSVNNSRIQLMIEKHPYDITKMLHELVSEKVLVVEGYGKGKVYYLNLGFKENQEILETERLHEDQLKVINYILENGSINNSESREKLGFKKHKSIRVFNSLINKNKIEKKGLSSATHYVIKGE